MMMSTLALVGLHTPTVSIKRPTGNPSERLQKSDQRLFVGIAEVGAEIVAAVDDVIRAFAQREELLANIREYLARLLVASARRQCLQVMHQLHDNLDHRLVAQQPLAQVRRLRQRVEIGQQVDWRSSGDGTESTCWPISTRCRSLR